MVEKIGGGGRIPPVEPVIRSGESTEKTPEQRVAEKMALLEAEKRKRREDEARRRGGIDTEEEAERRRREEEARKRGGVDTTI